MNLEAGLQLPDLRGIVRRRAKVVLGVALVVALAGYWIAMALPNEYESFATVLVEPQSVDPDLVEAGVPQSDLNRRLGLMAAQILSRPRLSRVIDELGLYPEESNYLLREEVINLMRDHVRISPVVPELEKRQAAVRGDFQIDQFRIFFSDNDPVVARDVAQRLANDFIEEHIASRVKVSQKSVEFVEAELARLADAIQEVDARVSQVKAANPGRLPEEVANNQRRLERINADLALARREVAAARSDEAFFQSQTATAREMMRGSDRSTSPVERMRALEIALAEFDARGYTDKHPDVMEAKAQLELLRVQVEEAKRKGEGAGSFAEHSAAANAERARLRRIHAEQEIVALEQGTEDIQVLLAETHAVAEQLDALQREYRHLSQSYQDFSRRRLEAGVQADLERRQLGEQFRVLEAAFLAPEPSSPNRVMIIVIGVIFGVALGGGMGIVLEAADGTVHDARQLQNTLELPVLASIPEISLEPDRRRLRRGRIRTAALTSALVVFGLLGGAVNYWWVNGARSGAAEADKPASSAAADDMVRGGE
jgi:polysaccharide chain length determinant protein (PEP-CTERM system associated)